MHVPGMKATTGSEIIARNLVIVYLVHVPNLATTGKSF